MATDQTPCFPIGRDGAPVSEAERIRVAAKIATGAEKPSTQQHPDEAKLAISGTRLREMFANHETVPEEFSRREVIEVLQAYYDTLK